MADITIHLAGGTVDTSAQEEPSETLRMNTRSGLFIYGDNGTYRLIRFQEDFVLSIGYACHIDADSAQQTLSTLLPTFNESRIGDLKRTLIGQYILVIKKGLLLYIFSDFIGSRNIFYSLEGSLISTSFTRLENLLHTTPDDLDRNKVFEYLSMRYMLFPGWMNDSTIHKRIKGLLPYEYLVINLADSSFKIGSLAFSLDNRKETSCDILSRELLHILERVIFRNEFKDSLVAASLTGGRDSRLVAAVAAERYHSINYRIAVSPQNNNSSRDLKVARKVAKTRGIKLEVYHFEQNRDEEKFREITESFIPLYNHTITPLIENARSYAIGFGGAFGTQLFSAIPRYTTREYSETKLKLARQFIFVENRVWEYLNAALIEQFQKIKSTFHLLDADERDYIRLFEFFHAGRYASFIMSAYNRCGNQFEPYGSYAALELALRISPDLWGNHKKLSGDALVQQKAMAILHPDLGKIIAYRSCRPMLPLSPATLPLFLVGFGKQVVYRIQHGLMHFQKSSSPVNFPGGYHLSDGWDRPFLDRIQSNYVAV